ncbi:hypothetical protein [Lutispora sp.]|uniref:hypothetical protein n=1 Tax=Lutispora sp. TaxID=2828727 RepID=UPI002B1F09C6|nr:hypothetical protein [Lutispora sp.]MEA4960159.1 hypothetical protein [Lutispora sp.]
MLRIKKIIVAVMFTMMLTLIFFNYTNANSPKNEKIIQEVERRLQYANDDIKDTFKIEKISDKYEEIKYLDAIDLGGDIAREIDELDQMAPIGCTEPLYYISRGNDEVFILFKEADGTNTMLGSKKVEGIWKRDERRIKGTRILEIKAD